MITEFVSVRYCALLRSMCGGGGVAHPMDVFFRGVHRTFECFSAQGPPSHSPSHQTQPLPSAEVLSRCDAWFSIRNNTMWRAHMHGLRHGFFDLIVFFLFFASLSCTYSMVVMLNVMTKRPRHPSHASLLGILYLSPDVSLHHHRSLECTCDDLINAMAKTKWRSN
jgi:hypothetical protein